MPSPFARTPRSNSRGRTALALAVLASLLLSSAGCERHALPELDLGDSQKSLHGKDAGGGEDKDDEDEDDDSAPDDDSMDDLGTGDGDGDSTMTPGDPMTDPDPDAGPPIDPDDRTPSPGNFAGCPDTAPKNGPAACVLDQAVVCVYGANYRCWCAFAAWLCD